MRCAAAQHTTNAANMMLCVPCLPGVSCTVCVHGINTRHQHARISNYSTEHCQLASRLSFLLSPRQQVRSASQVSAVQPTFERAPSHASCTQTLLLLQAADDGALETSKILPPSPTEIPKTQHTTLFEPCHAVFPRTSVTLQVNPSTARVVHLDHAYVWNWCRFNR